MNRSISTPNLQIQFWLYLVGVVVGFLLVPLIKKEAPCETPVSSEILESIDSSDLLFHKVRILCWMPTSPEFLKKRAQHVLSTWSSRCNIFVVTGAAEDKEAGVIGLPNAKEGGDNLYLKTKESYKYVWYHYQNEAEWFMKADDDTYAIMENLRLFLMDKNPEDPIWYGNVLQQIVKQGYMSGGAGYILSKEAVRRFVNGINSNLGDCSQGLGPEDAHIGSCLQYLGVRAGDDRDREGREIFHALHMDRYTSTHLSGKVTAFNIMAYPRCGGINCTTRWPGTFHRAAPEELYMLEYLFYNAEVNGRCLNGYADG